MNSVDVYQSMKDNGLVGQLPWLIHKTQGHPGQDIPPGIGATCAFCAGMRMFFG